MYESSEEITTIRDYNSYIYTISLINSVLTRMLNKMNKRLMWPELS